jgi:hypothetical protein
MSKQRPKACVVTELPPLLSLSRAHVREHPYTDHGGRQSCSVAGQASVGQLEFYDQAPDMLLLSTEQVICMPAHKRQIMVACFSSVLKQKAHTHVFPSHMVVIV